ncbi:long-chain fatty alcohol dehydrogenase [Xylariaceae sp. FL0016]|nr:long-chain fatty alcohol dehydrogenase [Xylariaceae sp. FL0016]
MEKPTLPPFETVSRSPTKDAAEFDEFQWRALFALLDAVIPSVVVGDRDKANGNSICISENEFQDLFQSIQRKMKHPPGQDDFREYLASRPINDAKFVTTVKETLAELRPAPRKKLRGILDFMVTRFGGLLSTGYWAPFTEQPTHVREAILQSWQDAWLFIWPLIAKNFFVMAKAAWAKTDPLLLKLSGYQTSADLSRQREPGPAIDYNFLQFDEAAAEPESLETDVVIVGSGCGGGVCAKVLAEAGHRVIVVDKGHYYAPEQLPMTMETSGRLFESGGSIQTKDGSILVSAGKCWGGGSTVNWNVSIPITDEVRQEWTREHGIAFFTTPEFQDCVDRVCEVMGVSDAHIQQNHANRVVLDGSKALGWKSKPLPQNTGRSRHQCGSQCAMGCRTSTKQGSSVSWLPAASKAGAHFIQGFDVSEVLFETENQSRKAVGIVGKWSHPDPETKAEDQRRITIRAKKVIVSSGSLNTPLLLLRSGLTVRRRTILRMSNGLLTLRQNPHIGKNLHLHPCGSMIASFSEDVKGWEGEIMTSLMYEFDNLDGRGHGPRIEVPSMLPYVAFMQLPWHSGLRFKMEALGYRQMSTFLSLPRDRDSGSIYPDRNGDPTIDYVTSKFDRNHIKVGLVAIAKLCYIQGATEIVPPVRGCPPFQCTTPAGARTIADAAFVQWLRRFEQTDFSSAILISGHQMGSCRMSSAESNGVVDADGKVWETEDLYVADASVFPSASGVNPMVTVMAIADKIARNVSQSLR